MNHILALILIVGSLALAQEPKSPDQPPAPDAAAAGPKQPAPPKIKTMRFTMAKHIVFILGGISLHVNFKIRGVFPC